MLILLVFEFLRLMISHEHSKLLCETPKLNFKASRPPSRLLGMEIRMDPWTRHRLGGEGRANPATKG